MDLRSRDALLTAGTAALWILGIALILLGDFALALTGIVLVVLSTVVFIVDARTLLKRAERQAGN